MSFTVPSTTTVNESEYRPGLNILPFAPELITFITKNMKLTTYRFGDKYSYLTAGDIVAVQNSATGELICKARIRSASKTTFANLPLDDGGHESYEDKEHQRKVFSGYYGYLGRDIKNDDPFLVISFELINRECIDKYAKTIWDYMRMHQKLEKAELIICFGSHDLRSAEWAARLYLDGCAPSILFSGKQDGRKTRERSEAEVYKARAVEMGVPPAAIFIEDCSTNTGENIQFACRFLEENNMCPDKIIVVHKPYMERRTFATLKAQWPRPQPQFIMSSLLVTYEEYMSNPQYQKDYILNVMVGDLQRIKEYPRLGYQVEQEMPEDVWEAFGELVRLGYNQRLVKL